MHNSSYSTEYQEIVIIMKKKDMTKIGERRFETFGEIQTPLSNEVM